MGGSTPTTFSRVTTKRLPAPLPNLLRTKTPSRYPTVPRIDPTVPSARARRRGSLGVPLVTARSA
eukprot:160356-Pyramimonas_sp.AAC.2